jgi:hypothetical protein
VSRGGLLATSVALLLAVAGTIAACNASQGDCPGKGTIGPGASCSADQLQCAYDLATPAAACDGTTTVIPSSCTCTEGSWVCPSAFDCDAGSVDGGATEDGSQADADATG